MLDLLVDQDPSGRFFIIVVTDKYKLAQEVKYNKQVLLGFLNVLDIAATINDQLVWDKLMTNLKLAYTDVQTSLARLGEIGEV